jgi:hypothetical protein
VNRHEQYTGWKIVVGFLARDMDLDDGAFDVGESAQRYSNLCVEALRRAYPGAEITVSWAMEPGTTPRGTEVVAPKGSTPRDMLGQHTRVRHICDRIRDTEEWRVKKA